MSDDVAASPAFLKRLSTYRKIWSRTKFGTCASFIFFIPGWIPPPLGDFYFSCRFQESLQPCAILSWIDLHDILRICHQFWLQVSQGWNDAFQSLVRCFRTCIYFRSLFRMDEIGMSWFQFFAYLSPIALPILLLPEPYRTYIWSFFLFFFTLIHPWARSQQLKFQLWFSISV
jgi:hypothetical protein